MDIIPFPAHIETQTGEFRLTSNTKILTDTANLWNADFLHNLLTLPTGFPLQVLIRDQTDINVIRLNLNSGLSSLGLEGYRLAVQPGVVVVEAPTTTGVFYGIQSLRQLFPVEIEQHHLVKTDWIIACLTITDQPRFSWRGFLLDEGRHFQGKETVLLTLDLMALQKLNILHWHLTEDQGWRIEIKKYPRLTDIGSKRSGTSRSFLGVKHDGVPHSGFYTQDEIREIVAYADMRHITIVPEIEVPGHSMAALASYPELSCTGGPFNVATHFGIYSDIYCAGKEATFTFLQNVINEMLDLFPSPFIHIGGDEAPKKRWKECPNCQDRIRELGLIDEHGLQVWFTNRIANYLDSLGRRAVGWNEILQEGLTKSAIVQYWARHRKVLLKALGDGNRATIMSTYLDAYLDHSYSLMPLSRAYRFDPVPKELNGKEVGSILGLEFPLWSEWIPNHARLDYQTYPRLTAMAETGWTLKDNKDFKSFRQRLAVFLNRLDGFGIKYAPLKEAEPSRVRQLFGILTILQPQTKTAG